MAGLQKALYGNTAIYRKYCYKCKTTSLIINGKYACCGGSARQSRKEKVRRMTATFFRHRVSVCKRKQTAILKQQENKCIYCDYEIGSLIWSTTSHKYIKTTVNFDHFVPWSYDNNNKIKNIVASCNICNALKTNYHFESIEKAKSFILERWKQKGYW